MPSFGAPPPLLPHTHRSPASPSPSPSPRAAVSCPPLSSPLSLSGPAEQESEKKRVSEHPLLPRSEKEKMELLFELLLTAAATLLAAFLLATLFAANDPRREPPRDRAVAEEAAAAVEGEEEERIIEVDEVKLRGGRAELAAAPAEAEGWVEVDKAPAVVVEEEEEEEEEPGCSPEEEAGGAVPVRAGVEGERQEEAYVGEKRPDSSAAAPGVVAEANPHVLGAEAVPREVLDVAGLEKRVVQDVGAEQHDLVAEVAPSEVLVARPEKQGDQVVEVAEVLPMKAEAAEAKQHHLVAEVAPAAEVLDVALEEKSVQAIEVSPGELVSRDSHEEVPDVELEKEVQQVAEEKQHELTVEVAPQPIIDVPLAEKEEHNDRQHADEAVDVHQEEQSKDEAKFQTHPADPAKELVPAEEFVARKTDNVEDNHESSSSEKAIAELPMDEVALQGLPEGDAGADMDFGEWEGIERSEVEKRFGVAAAFAASEAGVTALSKLDSDVQMQLQGLLKVAIDGPCYDATQPLTLRPSSRAKWVAWQKLGNMHPEVAMEKYMNLLTQTIPGWMGNGTLDTKKLEGEGPILTMTSASDQHSNPGTEDSTVIDEGHLTTSPNPEKGQSSDIPAE
ncbi:hypothetical protein ACP4OV_015481 [Aristida adscensionis]